MCTVTPSSAFPTARRSFQCFLCLFLLSAHLCSGVRGHRELNAATTDLCNAVTHELQSPNVSSTPLPAYLFLTLNPQRYASGGCFLTPHEPLANASSDGGVEALRSALFAFDPNLHLAAWRVPFFRTHTSLRALQQYAAAATGEISTKLFQDAQETFLRDTLANGSLMIVPFQSISGGKLGSYINTIEHAHYAVVSGANATHLFLRDPRTETLRRVETRAFYYERWKALDASYGWGGMCSRCGLVLTRGRRTTPLCLRRTNMCPETEPMP